MASALRLGYLVPQFPGQTHMFFWREILALEARDVEVVLLSTRYPPTGVVSHKWSGDATARTTYLAKVDPVAALAAMPKLPMRELAGELGREPTAFWRDVLVSVPAAQALLKVARDRALQHVHVHSAGRGALIAALARTMGGPPYSLTLHGPRLEDYGPGQRFKWRHAAFGTAVTEKLRADLIQSLGGDTPTRLRVQPMGVDAAYLSRSHAWAPPVAGGRLSLFCCGRLNAVKGHEHLLAAIKNLRASGHDIHLTVAGEDDLGGNGFRKVLEARVAELELTDAVTFLGATNEAEVKRCLLACHFFVLPSIREALPVALMEAMSCAVPAIATDVGNVAELIVDGETGVLIPTQDSSAIATAIVRLVSDATYAERLGRAAREKIVSGYTAERGAETLIAEILT